MKLKGYKPKIVQLSLSDSGGAGTATWRLHKGLIALGHDSTMIVGHKKRNDPTVRIVSNNCIYNDDTPMPNTKQNGDLVKSAYRRWKNNMEAYPLRPAGLEVFTDLSSDIRIEHIPEIIHADIIHLHWISGLIDLPHTFSHLNGKPVVWTLHDLNAFTGGCHYSAGCLKYRKRCGACPALGSSLEEDMSRSIWKQRAALYSHLDLHIVCPSEWLAGEAKRSSLLANSPVTKISNGHPLEIFTFSNAQEFKKQHGILENEYVILFSADAVSNLRKGFGLIRKALPYLAKRLPPYKRVVLVTMGRNPVDFPIQPNLRLLHLGSLSDEKQIATVYSAADVFVVPSLEDNLPNTIVEALACGTPVVGYNIGGISEMIQHKRTGFIAKPFDVVDLAAGMTWSLEAMQSDPNIAKRCRSFAQYHFDQRKQALTYSDLYRELLARRKCTCINKNKYMTGSDLTPITGRNKHHMQQRSQPDSIFLNSEFDRIYHYHIRKAGGTSMNFAFFRLSGNEPKELYTRINEEFYVKIDNLRYVGWKRDLINAGNYEYAFSHAAYHSICLPANTFTFCVLRDPIKRVLSHYKMLISMRDQDPKHPGYIKEASWVEAGFDGFIERVNRSELLCQLFMFSKHYDLDEAMSNIQSLSQILILDEHFGDDLENLREKTGLNLEYSHERRAKISFSPNEKQLSRLREVLEPEYRFFTTIVKELRKEKKPVSVTKELAKNNTQLHANIRINPIETAYSNLWNAKLNDSRWLQNDGKGRVEYACKILSAKLLPEHKILDIGCGRGTLGIWLNRKKGMFGVDIAPEAIKTAKTVYEEAHVIDIDTEALPYPDNSFDFVTYLDVIEHVYDPRVGLREIERVLKPGGTLLVSTPNILAYIDKIRETRRFPKTSGDSEPYDGGHIHFFTYKDIHALLKDTGYSDLQSASPIGSHPEYELKDRMVWVIGKKREPQKNVELESSGNFRKNYTAAIRHKEWTFPVALITYNRPEHTRQVLEALKECGPPKLYLFSDGPKTPVNNEKVGQVRELLRSIDWTSCEIIERTGNLGLAKSVIAAAEHVFARHNRMLLLEDDIVPYPSLFPFIEKALNKYAENKGVTGISGYAVPQPELMRQHYCYDAYFFPRISSWGWATWRRVWDRFEPNLPLLVRTAMQKGLDITIGGSDLFRNLKHAIQGRDIWTMNWILRSMLDDGVFLYPLESQVKNIGMDGSGIHCGRTDKFEINAPTRTIERLPDSIFIDPDLARTFYSFYDLEGTRRDLNVERIGPHPVKKFIVNDICHV